jgi:hypothetical protein
MGQLPRCLWLRQKAGLTLIERIFSYLTISSPILSGIGKNPVLAQTRAEVCVVADQSGCRSLGTLLKEPDEPV